jgi:hypothetical protein
MPRSSRLHVLTITLSQPDYDVFLAAVRILARVMRKQAPDVPTLVHSKLQRHDAAGLAEDYLDLVRWPLTRRRALHAPERTKRQPNHLKRNERAERIMAAKARPPRDVANN